MKTNDELVAEARQYRNAQIEADAANQKHSWIRFGAIGPAVRPPADCMADESKCDAHYASEVDAANQGINNPIAGGALGLGVFSALK